MPVPKAEVLELMRMNADPAELDEIRELWKEHSKAEDNRSIEGLLATLSDDDLKTLIDELTDIAVKEGIERLYTELPTDDRAAIDVFQKRGFKLVARFERNILDRAGKYHDLGVYHLDLAERR